MNENFKIPARPWGEAEVALLTRNADSLPEDIRAELGLSVPPADNNFRANTEQTPVAESEVTPEVVETPEAAPEVTEETPEEEVPVVDNNTTDNA